MKQIKHIQYGVEKAGITKFGINTDKGITLKHNKPNKPIETIVIGETKNACKVLKELSNRKLSSGVKITQTNKGITEEITLKKTVKQDIQEKQDLQEIPDKYETFEYSTTKHKPSIRCKVKDTHKPTVIKQFIHNCKGSNYDISNNMDLVDLNRTQKIITFGNTDLGFTDNTINTHINETFGYPFKRQIITKQIDNNDLEVELITQYYQLETKLDNNDLNRIITLKGYNKHKQLKHILDDNFVNRIAKTYYKMYFDIQQTNDFRYAEIVKSLKEIDGYTVIRFMKQIIIWLRNNSTSYTTHNNGLYRYNIQHLKYTLKQIEDNGLLDKNYVLSTKTHKTAFNDKTTITQDTYNRWIKQNKKLQLKEEKYLKQQ